MTREIAVIRDQHMRMVAVDTDTHKPLMIQKKQGGKPGVRTMVYTEGETHLSFFLRVHRYATEHEMVVKQEPTFLTEPFEGWAQVNLSVYRRNGIHPNRYTEIINGATIRPTILLVHSSARMFIMIERRRKTDTLWSFRPNGLYEWHLTVRRLGNLATLEPLAVLDSEDAVKEHLPDVLRLQRVRAWL